MLLYWIWYAQAQKVSAHVKQMLLRQFRDPEEIYNAEEETLSAVDGISADALEALLDRDLTQARTILDICARKEIRVLTYGDPEYPTRLRNLYDPPMVLYYKGTLPLWEARPVIGIVGTRKASVYGLNTAKKFGAQIAACGAVVISGCATGIDSMAMEGALAAGMPVVGVLGGGVDVVYPTKNRGLFAKVESSGCLISEYPPGDAPVGWHFPLRNRIITGISNGLLVVEAPERSGALISARHAMEQGRDVFVVPGNVGVETCAGSNALLEEQALPALSGWHVMREYEAQYPGVVQKRDVPVVAEMPQAEVAQIPKVPEETPVIPAVSDKKSIDKNDKSTYSVLNNPPANLNQEEQQVLSRIGREPVTVDEVIDDTELSPATVKSVLTRLIIKGMVRNLPGGRVARK